MMGFGDGIGISWTICRQSAPHSRHITTLTPTPHHSICTGQMLFLTPNQQCQSTEGSIFIIIIIVMIINIFVLCHKVVTSASVLGDDVVTCAPLFLQHPVCCGCFYNKWWLAWCFSMISDVCSRLPGTVDITSH